MLYADDHVPDATAVQVELRAVRFYGVVDDSLGEAVELFDRREAERVVEDWDRVMRQRGRVEG